MPEGRSNADAWRGAVVRALRRWPVALLVAALAAAEALRLALDPRPLDVPVVALFLALAALLVRRRRAGASRGPGSALEAESFARILRGLARSVSPETIVDAIVEELGATTGATHVAVIRRRPEAGHLEAVLSATRPGTPKSRTTFPLSELEDPTGSTVRPRTLLPGSPARRLAAVPILPDPSGDPHLAPLGLAPASPAVARDPRAGDSPQWPVPAPAALAGASPAPSAPGTRVNPGAPGGEAAAQRIADHLAYRIRDAYGLRNLIAAPLPVDGRLEGAIVLARRIEEPWPDAARRILGAAAIETSAALGRLYTLRDAETRATIDALTGLPNRRYFDEYVTLLSRRRRAEDRVGVLMIDLDRFKDLNDTFGHAVGDQVLQAVARAIAGAVRGQDVPARFGGEEFVVLLRNPGPEIAVEVGERIRRAIGALDLNEIGVPAVSVSVGVAVAPSGDRPLSETIEEADRALYRAKRAGRDRVVAA